LSQLSFALIGALAYAGMQSTKKAAKSRMPNKQFKKEFKMENVDDDAVAPKNKAAQPRRPLEDRTCRHHSPGNAPVKPKRDRDTNMAGKQEVWQPSAKPISAPTFNADCFETQVQELVTEIAPTAEGDKIVQQLAATAKRMLENLFPEAEVVGFASADVRRGTAFGVAIPEVDIILSARPSELAKRLSMRTQRPLLHAGNLDTYKLQKSALRACTDELVAAGGFKFRRSAFKGLEPKITLIAPASMGIHTDSVPISFSVNTVTPLYSVALLTECGHIDQRAKELILLVRRWAKDRGISHAAKGHLSPYAWGLLAIYFLQVSDIDIGPLLPALDGFKLSSSLVHAKKQEPAKDSQIPQAAVSPGDGRRKSVAVMFTELAEFYNKSFNWRNEAVSVRAGKRAAPSLSLPVHVTVSDTGSAEGALNVEDPFNPKRNCSSYMTAVSIARLREELARVSELTSRQAALSELLEPWVPLEAEAREKDE